MHKGPASARQANRSCSARAVLARSAAFAAARGNTIALGDSGNDLSMLRLVDCPILIPKPDGRFSREVLEALPNIVQAKRPGPAGWSSSLLRELQRNSQGTASPPSARYYLEMTEVGKTGAVSEQKH